jgi:para-aminobenzoate synthetase
VYSGALGFLSVDGAVDLSVAIRVAVLDSRGARVGAGGAVISLSDAEEEWQEVRLKARSVTQAF